MEKRRPHFPLPLVARLAGQRDSVRFTRAAIQGAAELEMTITDMVHILRFLTPQDFFKSMTSYADHESWQDVYRPKYRGISLYLKLTVIPETNLLLVSFKRR